MAYHVVGGSSSDEDVENIYDDESNQGSLQCACLIIVSLVAVTAMFRICCRRPTSRATEEAVPVDIMRRRTGRPLFMHVHLPKTSGTHTIHAMLHALCNASAETPWAEASFARLVGCARTSIAKCPDTLIDTSVSCLGSPRGAYHGSLAALEPRAHLIAKHYSVPMVVYVTTLRPAVERLISHWRHWEQNCIDPSQLALELASRMAQVPLPMAHGRRLDVANSSLISLFCSSPVGNYPLPRDIPKGSNASLLHFMRAAHAANDSNLQLQLLAAPFARRRSEERRVDAADLRRLQQRWRAPTAKNESWVVGFSACVHRFVARMASINDAMAPLTVTHMSPPPPSTTAGNAHLAHEHAAAPTRPTGTLHLAPEVLREARRLNALDDELYVWAREQSRSMPLTFLACSEQEERNAYTYTGWHARAST